MNSVPVNDSLKCPVEKLVTNMAGNAKASDVPVGDTTPVPPPPQIKDLDQLLPKDQDRGSKIR